MRFGEWLTRCRSKFGGSGVMADSAAPFDRGPEPLPGYYDDRPKSREASTYLERLELRNTVSIDPVIDPTSKVTVSLTTHGGRIERAFLAIETIASGNALPARLVLTLGETDAATPLPATLGRLVERGLEIVIVPDRIRVHSKYWGVVSAFKTHSTPLVVADDDQLYPTNWLEGLLKASESNPQCVVANRVHRIAITQAGVIAPYLEWEPFSGTQPSFAAFGTGVSGMLLPPLLLDFLLEEGESFLSIAPNADDVWLHSRAVKAGLQTRQVSEHPANYDFVPGTQHVGLYLANVHRCENDVQIEAAYDAETVRRIREDPVVERPKSTMTR